MPDKEIEEIRERYRRRELKGLDGAFGLLEAYCYLSHQEKERAFLNLLSRFPSSRLQSFQVIEIGCGDGDNILQLIRWGFKPKNIAGNDLLPTRCARARERLPPAIKIIEGDASKLDIPDESFDIILVSTVFSSILDDDTQRSLATKIWSLLKPGGTVLWYDFTYDNPSNPDVKGVTYSRIGALFPEAKPLMRRITLAPPIARLVCEIHPQLYAWFSLFRFLKTHLIGALEKPASASAAKA